MNANRHSSKPGAQSSIRLNMIEEVDSSKQNFVHGIQYNDLIPSSKESRLSKNSQVMHSRESNWTKFEL